jgi:hypothetical protein
MPILPALAVQFQGLFPSCDQGRERARRFILTLQAILLPITASRTSSLLRNIATLFGVAIGKAKLYTSMVMVKLQATLALRCVLPVAVRGRADGRATAWCASAVSRRWRLRSGSRQPSIRSISTVRLATSWRPSRW